MFSPLKRPPFLKDAVLYEVNLRQYTSRGDFAAFAPHLPRLAELGVNVLWFMPLGPIGRVARKGGLGSYYSLADYCAVAPEYGTLEDFKDLVASAHRLGMKVILDWVAEHTSRDAVWIKKHPDWYVQGPDSRPESPFDWTDVARLDYRRRPMQKAMQQAMLFWVRETDIDGFRCDMAHLVPTPFWEETAALLRAAKPLLFLLAEAETPDLLYRAFDSCYGWKMQEVMLGLASGKRDANALRQCLNDDRRNFYQNAPKIYFTSNHDENSWHGSEYRRYGAAARQMAVLSFFLEGIPLLYTGQEVGNDRALAFFEKDCIVPEPARGAEGFYRELISLRRTHESLFAPPWGAPLREVNVDKPLSVFAFERVLSEDAALAVFNFSGRDRTVRMENNNVCPAQTITLPAFGWRYFFKTTEKTPAPASNVRAPSRPTEPSGLPGANATAGDNAGARK